MVVGPLGEAMRVGAGFTMGARLRTTLGSIAAGTGADSTIGAAVVVSIDSTGLDTRLTRAGGASTISGAAATAAAFFVPVTLVALAALAATSG